jgi:hypothetical protein
MIDNNIKFWYHPLIGGTGIQGLVETYFNLSFEKYDKFKVNQYKKNVIIFFWETTASINLEFKTNNSDFFELVKELNELGFYFLADYSTEANTFVDEERVLFLNKLKDINLNFNRFFLVTNSSSHPRNIKYGPHEIKHLYFPHFILETPLKMKEYIDDISIYDNIIPTKDFLCLNRRVQEHKFNFANRLSELGLITYTNLSLVANKTNPELIRNSSLVKELNIDVDNFQSIQLEGDVMYGKELDTADQYLYTINPKWYFDSKINIVVETNHGDSPTHITEKTIKPIYLKRPFVIYGTQMHLNQLQNFGFTTFDDLIGEYDCTDIDSVINAAIKLSFIYNHNNVKSSCDWNYENLINSNVLVGILETHFLCKIH